MGALEDVGLSDVAEAGALRAAPIVCDLAPARASWHVYLAGESLVADHVGLDARVGRIRGEHGESPARNELVEGPGAFAVALKVGLSARDLRPWAVRPMRPFRLDMACPGLAVREQGWIHADGRGYGVCVGRKLGELRWRDGLVLGPRVRQPLVLVEGLVGVLDLACGKALLAERHRQRGEVGQLRRGRGRCSLGVDGHRGACIRRHVDRVGCGLAQLLGELWHRSEAVAFGILEPRLEEGDLLVRAVGVELSAHLVDHDGLQAPLAHHSLVASAASGERRGARELHGCPVEPIARIGLAEVAICICRGDPLPGLECLAHRVSRLVDEGHARDRHVRSVDPALEEHLPSYEVALARGVEVSRDARLIRCAQLR